VNPKIAIESIKNLKKLDIIRQGELKPFTQKVKGKNRIKFKRGKEEISSHSGLIVIGKILWHFTEVAGKLICHARGFVIKLWSIHKEIFLLFEKSTQMLSLLDTS